MIAKVLGALRDRYERHKFYVANRYERHKLYVANPCDADAHRWLRPLGYALGLLSVPCPCCSAVRILLALLLGAFAPKAVVGAVFVAVFVMVVAVYIRWGWHERARRPRKA